MEIIELLKNNKWILNIIYSVLVIILSTLFYLLLDRFITKKTEENTLKFLMGKKSKTYMKMIKSTSKYILILIVVFTILQINGVNISSMLAGIGIIGIIIGFAIQDALKDIIKGIDIISDSYYQVGDIIKYGDNIGKVLSIGLKTTKIQDIRTLNIISISNRNIEIVEVESHLINIDIPLSYELPLKKAEEVIKYIIENIENKLKVEKAEYKGVNELADSSINYQIKVYCNPENKIQTRRDCLRTIVECLEENSIQIPYNQLDIHEKNMK